MLSYTCRDGRSAVVDVCGLYVRSALVFQVVTQNRYKLNKKYRWVTDALARDPDNQDLRRVLENIKVTCGLLLSAGTRGRMLSRANATTVMYR